MALISKQGAQSSASSEDAGFFKKKKIESKLGRDRNKFRVAVMTFEKVIFSLFKKSTYNSLIIGIPSL